MITAKTEMGKRKIIYTALMNNVRARAMAFARYYESPNLCEECGGVIHPRDGSVSDTRKKRFCNHSCAAKYSNRIPRPSRRKMDDVVCYGCGKAFKIWHRRTYKRKNHFHSKECWIKHLKTLKGKNHPSWKGGHPSTSKNFYNSVEWHTVRYKAFGRDKFTCLHCGKCGGKIEAHHIKPRLQFPELALKLNNLATLCKPCHKKEHKR